MKPLHGRRILIIGIGFYDYEAAIAAEFRGQGADVWTETEQPIGGRGGWLGRRGDEAQRRHQSGMLERVRALGVLDDILVIKGESLDDLFIASLRAAQPRAQLIAYHWDSMARFPELVRRQALFDRVLTFDHADAMTYPSFHLRPLFFRPELRLPPPSGAPIDLCFVGWLHHDRLALVEALREQAAAAGLSSFFYLSTGWKTWARLKVAGRGRDVHARPIGFGEYVSATLRARVIVDLPHPLQTGLTMRAIEALGAGKKLLTTASDIAAYTAFDARNVTLLDPNQPKIDVSFVATPPVETSAVAVDQYSLAGWAGDVLGVTEPGDFLNATARKRMPS
jgi:hypothetical protein